VAGGLVEHIGDEPELQENGMHQLSDLATQVGRALQQRGWRLATCESITGGGISQAITDIAGSSEWFDCGLVTYSNA